jgi:hypothetical protein
MKRHSSLLIAILMLTVGLSTAHASARAKSACVEAAFPLILGVGY